MIISKSKFVLHSISFRFINIGLAIILFYHFLSPGLTDEAALIGYLLIIIGDIYISSIWKEFYSALLYFIPGMILSALALWPLNQEGIGLFVYMDYSYNQIGLYWGTIILLVDIISMMHLAVLIKKRANGDGQMRTYTDGDDLLYAKLKGEVIGDSKGMQYGLIALGPIFAARMIVKIYMIIVAVDAVNAGSNAMFVYQNLMFVNIGIMIILIVCTLFIIWYISDICSAVSKLMKDADGKNKTI